jgi:hypothetical protein
MSYAVEWMGGVVVLWIALLLAFVPWFAAVAAVLAAIAILVIALAALVGLVALAAAVLASPYLVVHNVRHRLTARRTRRIHAPSGIPNRSAAGSPARLGRPHLTALANHHPDEAGAVLEDVNRHAA